MAQAATQPTPSLTLQNAPTKVRVRTPWQDAWSRLLRNRAAVAALLVIALYGIAAIGAPIIAPYDYATQDLQHTTQGPSAEHWMGTDQLGRDVFTRLLYGARISFAVAVAAQLIIIGIGLPMGLVSGYFGGGIDTFIT